jgi:hypothetical protein
MTGIHYGTGKRSEDISVMDSVHAMRVSLNPFLSPSYNYYTDNTKSVGGFASSPTHVQSR